MAAGDVYSAGLPSSLGDILGSLVRAVNQGQIEGFADWEATYLQPAFKLLTSGGVPAAQAIGLLLADGMPKPGQVAPLSLKLQANAASLINTGSDVKVGGSLGFTPANLPLLAGLNAAISGSVENTQTTQMQSQANSELDLQVFPVTATGFLAGLVQAMQGVNGLTTLPSFLTPPASTPATAGGGAGTASSKS